MLLAAAAAGAYDGLLLTDDERHRYAEAGTWHELFDPADWANRAPLAAWIVALVVLGVIAFPYVWVAARALPDAGYSVARPLGLLLVAWPVWWLASAGSVEPGRTALAVAVLVLACGAAAIVRVHRQALRRWLAVRWRVVVVSELVFWSLFGAVLAVRWSNPDLWHPSLGGEKPMDLAFLNAAVKSPEFPPYDPWFAGGYVNYYYFGFVLVGALVELTGVVPHVAYNLAVPTLAASLGSAAFGAALALSARGRPPRRRALTTGVLAAGFVAVVGNLGQVEVVVRHLRGGVPLDWWYWTASRAISVPAGEPGPITEFPAFTYLYADLHAHAVALPYTAAVLVLALAVVAGRRRVSPWGRAATLALLALVLGALWPTNTWDFPTYAAVVAVALAAAGGAGGLRLAGTARALATWLAVVAAAWLLYLPFHLSYESAFAGVTRWRGARTGIVDYVTVHGLFLFVIVSALALEVARERRLGATARLLRLLARRPRRVGRALALRRVVAPRADVALGVSAAVVAAVVVAAGLVVAGAAVPALILLVGVLAALAATRRRGPARAPGDVWRRLTVALAVLALGLTLAVELAVVDRIDIGRNNTVFKTYVQVWVLWSLAAAVSLPVVYDHLRGVRRRWLVAWRSAFVLLLAAALLYPALATPAKIRDRFDRSVGPTLDGTAFMAAATYADKDVDMPLADDLAGIRWMWAEAPGSPVVAELNTSPKLYGWGNRFAMFTGNPSVIGWDFHERQQRGVVADVQITERISDVQRAYRTEDADEAARLLARYGVDYVVVGRLERAYYPGGQAKWEAAVGRLWDPVFRHGALTIFRTRR